MNLASAGAARVTPCVAITQISTLSWEKEERHIDAVSNSTHVGYQYIQIILGQTTLSTRNPNFKDCPTTECTEYLHKANLIMSYF